MLVQAYCENTWLYPDTQISGNAASFALDAARGGTAAFQLLGDAVFQAEAPFILDFEAAGGITCIPYQLLPVQVEENSAADMLTTLDYTSVAHFVTRQAPFVVYDCTRDLDKGVVYPGRLALYILLRINRDVPPGRHACTLSFAAGDAAFSLSVTLTVHAAVIPPLEQTQFGMVNWLEPKYMVAHHHADHMSDTYWDLVRTYLQSELDIRTNHLMLPGGKPVYDNGSLIDFDFTESEIMGNMALQMGFSYIYGGFVARFEDWRDAEQFLLWDRGISATNEEGYRQLKIYFTKAWETVLKNGWRTRYMQCLVDEPQFPNSMTYRALSGICRKLMPGVIIHDPVESTDLEGSVDIWCVKQAVYEQYKAKYQRLQAMGEHMWVYTCGFPGGYWMNRIIDLPVLAGRLPMWLCRKYGFEGFLHWGYNSHNAEPFVSTCYQAGNGRHFPPGNGFIVYPGDGRPWLSVRAHVQRAGAEDYELLSQLDQKNHMAAIALIDRVCTDFHDYNADPANFAEVRRELLCRLDTAL